LAGGAVELLFAAALPTDTVEVRGEGVDGMWDARWPAAESQILLVVGMDHIDPPVRTNHSEFEIEIAYGLAAGGERDLGPTSTNGVMRADHAIRRLSSVHLYTVSPDRMRQNESVGLNSFRIEISAIFVRCAKSRRRTAKASTPQR
jgi:hypothetical protein